LLKVEKGIPVCYNRGTEEKGEYMENKINVLDIAIDNYSAKEAMQKTVEYMQSEPMNLVGVLTAKSLMHAAELEGYKENVARFDMVVAGETSVLEAAGVKERGKLKEAEMHIYLKMVMRYLSKHHRRVFLLTQSEILGNEVMQYLEADYKHIVIAGSIVVQEGETADDMIINEINGREIDCVIAVLESPLQEEFVLKNQPLIDTRIWLALGDSFVTNHSTRKRKGRLVDFWARHALKRENERYKKASWAAAQERGI